MERLNALYMLYAVAKQAHEHGHADIMNWALAEIKEHGEALKAGDHTQPELEADE